MTQEIEVLSRCVDMFDSAILKYRREIDILENKIYALETCRNEFEVKLSSAQEKECHWPEYQNNDMPIPSDNPEYIVASTSSRAEETYIFESNSEGHRINHSEYGGIALRYGHENWKDKMQAVRKCFPDKAYKLIKTWDWFDNDYTGSTSLYKREERLDEAPDEFTYWDGDETDRIQY